MRYGPVQEWKIEVVGDFRFYRDPYGKLQVADFDDDWSMDDQYWDRPNNAVRCRSRELGFDTYDPATGKLVSRKPSTSTVYGDCIVRVGPPRS